MNIYFGNVSQNARDLYSSLTFIVNLIFN